MKIERDLITKMIIAGILGVLIIVSVVIAIKMLANDKEANKVPAAAIEQVQEKVDKSTETEVVVEYDRILALVRGIDDASIQVFDIEENTEVTLVIDGTVHFEDEYGTQIVADMIKPGLIVNIKYDKATYVPELIKISPQIQVLKNLSSMMVDEALKTIQIGSDIYDYNDQLVALNGEAALDLSEVSVADDIVVRVYQGKVWSILVENGHGYIVLQNYSAYIDGRLEIGNRTSYIITKDMNIPISVGTHQVVITKDNMVPYTATVLIEEDTDFIIDLSDLQPQEAEVNIDIVQEGSSLYIDDVLTELNEEPLLLAYGQYNIKVVNDGYLDWEGILIVDQQYIDQTIDMEVKPLQLHMTGPDGAEFYLDGILMGLISGYDPVVVPIMPGGHVLTLRKDGYRAWSQSVFIEDSGEDYYYTVSDLDEIAQPEQDTTSDPATDSTSDPATDSATDPATDSGSTPAVEPGQETPVDDVYQSTDTGATTSTQDSGNTSGN